MSSAPLPRVWTQQLHFGCHGHRSLICPKIAVLSCRMLYPPKLEVRDPVHAKIAVPVPCFSTHPKLEVRTPSTLKLQCYLSVALVTSRVQRHFLSNTLTNSLARSTFFSRLSCLCFLAYSLATTYYLYHNLCRSFYFP